MATYDLKPPKPHLLKLPLDGKMPNSELPVVVYSRVTDVENAEALFRHVFKRNDWVGQWTDGIFGYSHFHSNAHEVLGVVADEAQLLLGGDGGEKLTVGKGDVLVLPAGTGHRRLRAGPEFRVVGAYPRGQEHYDIYLDAASCGNYRPRLQAVPGPHADPVYGKDGPLLGIWKLG